MVYETHGTEKRARREVLSLYECPPSSVNMNVFSDMNGWQCSSTESILSTKSSASDSRTLRSTNIHFSLSTECGSETNGDNDEDIHFPSYNDEDPQHLVIQPVEYPESLETVERAEDDIALGVVPSRHIDYLTHDWCEADILPSWRRVVLNRKMYNNTSRLENAAWRTWAKMRYKLKTAPADSLNWYVLVAID